MEKRAFVARERELEQLDSYLKRALSNLGGVCFVTGEAGSGKTTLISEFARRAQDAHPDLAVAVGQSDSQTGIGDANLPFREILGQLTGDVDAKLAQGAITPENASRLKKMLAYTGQALVELGPELIDVFVPGSKLLARFGTFIVDKVGWKDKLELIVGKKQKGTESGIQQSHIFEQYANVLGKLAEKHSLLLVLDDLQWADTASIELLFHLARRIEGHRILIVGAYRPEEVAIGRAGERHPLEKVLSELKRYYGEPRVDLDRAEQSEGRWFVEAFLNTEPNLLDEEFCQMLFQHTGGHPLFTIELLRNLQERGDLIQDERGRWLQAGSLNWDALPKKVEGVIEERIGRLNQELRRMLTIGSVEGEDFTAEVIARVQSADVRGLIPKLSEELDRQHRLVREEGVKRLEPTGQRLSQYKFQHNLFQKYLYNELGEAERTYLHEDVGNALEVLYGDQADEIVVQLAHHFDEAGIMGKARTYLERAGKQAAGRYANDEALTYFSRALDLTQDHPGEERYTLLLDREQIYGIQGERELQKQDLEALQQVVQTLGDDRMRAEAALRQAAFADVTSDYPAAITAAQESIRLGEKIQDKRDQALGHLQWGNVARMQGDIETALQQFAQALTLCKETGLRQAEANTLRGMGLIAAGQGEYERAKKYYEESLRILREDADRLNESKTLNNLGVVCVEEGDYAKAKTYFEQALVVFREIGDKRREGIILGNLGTIAYNLGDLRVSQAYDEQALRIHRETGSRDAEAVGLGNLGVMATMLGDFQTAKNYFEQALTIAQETGRQMDECFFLKEMGFTLCLEGDYSAGGDCCEQSLRTAKKIGEREREAEAHSKLGFALDCVGDYAGAGEHYDASLAITREVGIRPLEGEVLANMGLLCHHLGDQQTSLEHSKHAFEIAKELGTLDIQAYALIHLGHALVGLDRLTEAGDYYQQGVDLRSRLSQPHMAMEAMAGQARIKLMQGQAGEAQRIVDSILSFLENHSLDGTEEPLRVYLTCCHVLAANQDQRESGLIGSAYRMLMERAVKIKDEAKRKSYLENVAVNREIAEEHAK